MPGIPSTVPLGSVDLWHPRGGHAKRTDEFAFQLPEGRSQATLNLTLTPPMGRAKHIPPYAALSRSCSATCSQSTQRHPNAVYYPDHSLVTSLPCAYPLSLAHGHAHAPCPYPLAQYTLQLQTSKHYCLFRIVEYSRVTLFPWHDDSITFLLGKFKKKKKRFEHYPYSSIGYFYS